MAGSISKFIERMKYWCSSVSLGYDQSNRQDFRDGGETDCSALVIHALKEAGFSTGSASYTGNMRSNLTDRGWEVVSVNGNPQAGDILLNDVHHVAVYIGGGKLAQASIDENGRVTGGKGGDQSGRETNISPYYNYPWNCYLRWGGSTGTGAGKIAEDGFWGPGTTSALQPIYGISPDGIISGQYKNKANQNIPSADFSHTAWGSSLVRAMQKSMKAKGFYNGAIDGNIGPLFVKGLQKAFGLTQDGFISYPSNVVKALQRALNANKLPF